jgi:hypothetical protein
VNIPQSIVSVFQFEPYFYTGEILATDLTGNQIFVRVHPDEDHSSLRVTVDDENLPVLDSYKETMEKHRLSLIS